MNHRPAFSLADSSNLLRRTPALLDTWLRDLPEDWLHANEGPDTFSAFGVLGHLVYGERSDWIGRARHILEQRAGAFERFDRFGHQAEFKDVPLAGLLDTFANLRADNLDRLRALAITNAQLESQGTHPTFGSVTLGELLSTWVVHDQSHIAQIARVLAKCYSANVGPWREFLPILTDRA
ncbi:MAG: hypothetical protein ACI8QZ_003391 [Chlamydiales bacterium]|jgi:hypothetical protein